MASTSTAPPIRPILRKKKSANGAVPPSRSPPNKPSPSGLYSFSDLPPWRKDNAHILSSYRPESGSHLAALPSLFLLHNETCNIWSHLLGLFFFATFGLFFHLHLLPTAYPAHTPGDAVAFLCFFTGTCTCLAASAAYHLFSDVSHQHARVWNGVDYAGIVACVWGSFVACLHFGFPDDLPPSAPEGWVDVGRSRRRAYETMISSLAVVCTVVSVTPRFRTPAWRPFRASMFVAMGMSAVFPVAHGWAVYGREQLERQMSVGWVALQGGLYVLGAGLYAARIPERFAPGRFDLFGASHQIFHVLVVLAAGSHLVGLLKALDYACSQR
ncbi:mPR-like GPCR protein [Myriangium duriaei CBS 260.36]|uniref:MPR-like GPCR protein n=1 Tax=Myriangium duriaei CBS 260.36 TaxID=1168546 RepID=A0A9P4J2U3_9PEZI|nr:mPR-like GPCR protein [Myriangium duriaei CBS 260.36]